MKHLLIAGAVIALLWWYEQSTKAQGITRLPLTSPGNPGLKAILSTIPSAAASAIPAAAGGGGAAKQKGNQPSPSSSGSALPYELGGAMIGALPIAGLALTSSEAAAIPPVAEVTSTVLPYSSATAALFSGVATPVATIGSAGASLVDVSSPIIDGMTDTVAPGAITDLTGSTAAATSSSGGLTAGLTAALTNPAVIITAALAAAYLIARLIFRGADPNQVPAAMIEQSYEMSADIIYAWQQAGLIDQSTSVKLMEQIEAGIYSAEADAPQYHSDPAPFTNGYAHALQVIGNVMNSAKMLPSVPKVTFTVAAANAAIPYFDTTPGHWYPQSLSYAKQIVGKIAATLAGGIPSTPSPDAIATKSTAANAAVTSTISNYQSQSSAMSSAERLYMQRQILVAKAAIQ